MFLRSEPFCGPRSRGVAQWRGLTEGLTCGEAMRARLEAWGAVEETFQVVDGVDGSQIYRIPTKRLGIWTTLQLSSDSVPRVYRMDQNGTDVVIFGADCSVTEAHQPSTYPRDAFADDELRALLKDKGVLIVYHWSPHMPMSVEGYREIQEASTRLELGLVAVVDSASERDYVARTAEDAGISPEDRRPLGSVELLYRDLSLHAPSILVFTADWVAPVLPGYRDASDYEAYLKDLLGIE